MSEKWDAKGHLGAAAGRLRAALLSSGMADTHVYRDLCSRLEEMAFSPQLNISDAVWLRAEAAVIEKREGWLRSAGVTGRGSPLSLAALDATEDMLAAATLIERASHRT